MDLPVITWFKNKQLKCFSLMDKDGKKIHREEEAETFEESLQVLTSEISVLDTGKYTLNVWSKKGSVAEQSTYNFRILENKTSNTMGGGTDMNMFQMMLNMQREAHTEQARLNNQIFQLQLDQIKSSQESVNKSNALLESLTSILPSIAPQLLEKFLPKIK